MLFLETLLHFNLLKGLPDAGTGLYKKSAETGNLLIVEEIGSHSGGQLQGIGTQGHLCLLWVK